MNHESCRLTPFSFFNKKAIEMCPLSWVFPPKSLFLPLFYARYFLSAFVFVLFSPFFFWCNEKDARCKQGRAKEMAKVQETFHQAGQTQTQASSLTPRWPWWCKMVSSLASRYIKHIYRGYKSVKEKCGPGFSPEKCFKNCFRLNEHKAGHRQ